ncbi:hypothetical protein N7517_003088 [Penicillium concentricum]|uniref:Uncharacterized protein n=1 Tax=Penicillium concentricum TaxID=293559 RepID=A0A9W9SVK6_9EURO|nr:uncharacterized protein N7517_003088 [Penicillium concentricum]KAJ5385177.1 hypothetical protein N7517_003088 [Penicillium concentricum]
MGQDSVFIVPAEYLDDLEEYEDENRVGPQLLEDPDNHEAHWITVIIPEEMEDNHSDEDIMLHMLHNVRNQRAIVSASAMHNLGLICISVPVPVSTASTTTILAYAEADLCKWLELIRGGIVTLDREVIFGRQSWAVEQ